MNLKSMLLGALLLSGSCSFHKSGQVTWGRLPDLPNPVSISEAMSVSSEEPLGVSAPFVGLLDGSLVVAGGCNFPDKPVADGGTKRYYDEIWAIDLSARDPEWKVVGRLPRAVAYGCSVTTPSGIVCLGGNDAAQSSRDCFLLRWNADKSEVVSVGLNPLPFAVDNASAAFADNRVFVAGGNFDGKPSSAVLCGRVESFGESVEWLRMPDFPGPARVQPVLSAIGSGDELRLCLAGGFQPGDSSVPPVIPSDVLVWRKGEWTEGTALPPLPDGSLRTLTGGCSVAMSDRFALFFGGVNRDCFLAAIDRPRLISEAEAKGDSVEADRLRGESKEYLRHDVSWYRFNDELWSYDVIDDVWKCLGEDEGLARAGAGAVMLEDTLFVVCGELKPGIRSPRVSVVVINE